MLLALPRPFRLASDTDETDRLIAWPNRFCDVDPPLWFWPLLLLLPAASCWPRLALVAFVVLLGGGGDLWRRWIWSKRALEAMDVLMEAVEPVEGDERVPEEFTEEAFERCSWPSCLGL